jgi:cell division protein FtsN
MSAGICASATTPSPNDAANVVVVVLVVVITVTIVIAAALRIRMNAEPLVQRDANPRQQAQGLPPADSNARRLTMEAPQKTAPRNSPTKMAKSGSAHSTGGSMEIDPYAGR